MKCWLSIVWSFPFLTLSILSLSLLLFMLASAIWTVRSYLDRGLTFDSCDCFLRALTYLDAFRFSALFTFKSFSPRANIGFVCGNTSGIKLKLHWIVFFHQFRLQSNAPGHCPISHVNTVHVFLLFLGIICVTKPCDTFLLPICKHKNCYMYWQLF